MGSSLPPKRDPYGNLLYDTGGLAVGAIKGIGNEIRNTFAPDSAMPPPPSREAVMAAANAEAKRKEKQANAAHAAEVAAKGAAQAANPATQDPSTAAAAAAVAPQAALPPSGRVVSMKMPDGRIRMVNAEDVAHLRGQGGAETTGQQLEGKDTFLKKVAGGPPVGDTPSASSEAFWEQVRSGAQATSDAAARERGFSSALEDPGGTFHDVAGGGRMRRLSGLENAISRRDYTEGRLQQERALEEAGQGHEVRTAQGEQALEAAKVPPLEAARIAAFSKYGGEEIKARQEAGAREAALAEARKEWQIAQNFRSSAAAVQAKDPGHAKQLMDEADRHDRLSRETAAIILGIAPHDPKLNDLAALFGGFGLGGPQPQAPPATR